jgi:hypothetical protein
MAVRRWYLHPSITEKSTPHKDQVNAATTRIATWIPGRWARPKTGIKPLWQRKLAAYARWLHIYISMACFTILLFFAITGLTLNHQDWFAKQQKTVEFQGNVNKAWVNTADPKMVAKLEIVGFLRRTHGVKAALADFRVEGTQCEISFKGPGYEADAFIDRDTGHYQMTESRMGLVGVMNDLHKARDTGKGWADIVDGCAGLMIIVSLTGLTLIFFLGKRRASGLLVLGIGLAVFYLAYVIFIP